MLARMFSSAWSSNKTDDEVRRICSWHQILQLRYSAEASKSS